MANQTNVVLQASVKVFGFDANIDIQLIGGPVSIRLSPAHPVNFQDVWHGLSNAIEEIAGFGLPDLGAWKGLITAPSFIAPSLLLSPSGSNQGGLSVYLELAFLTPIKIGGTIDIGGGLEVSITPNFEVWALYLGYDAGAGGLSIRAKVSTPTSTGPGSPGGDKTQIVTYPFPVPAQDSVGVFKVHYLGLGQRVGPTVVVTAEDPLAAIFDQLENELVGDDPTTVLTTLARNFYQPDRDWFIAADVEMKGFRIRLLFNDPTMYGLEITVAANSPTPFAGLLFEILYQKLSPNLGVYYGALTLPTLMRRIPLEGFILILPGFSIWVYTNGDFRVNVGWPLGDNSIGISVAELLVGRAGFYFAKLRSADNPGAQANANYDPILAFGIGMSLSAEKDFNQSIFSATLAVTLYATFQGLLAWEAGNEVTGPPDHYWFAGTAGLSVLIQGSVDFSIIKASVLISFTANVSVAFETGYSTLITVSASVKVEVSIKVLFFKISLSFHTTVGTQFQIGSGPAASVNGPLAPGLAIVGGFKAMSPVHENALNAANRMLTRLRPTRPQPSLRMAPEPFSLLESASRAATPAPAELDLEFLLQPTVVYTPSGGSFNLIATLVTDCPSPGSPTGSPGRTSFERLLIAMVNWLLAMKPDGTLSQRFQYIVDALGAGSEPPLGDWNLFATRLRSFLQNACTFRIRGLDATSPSTERAAAVLPMLDALRMTYTGTEGPRTLDFDAYNLAPENYPLAVNLYYEDVAWSGSSPPQATTRKLTAPSSPTGGPSMASFVFVDYFLMQARNAANALLRAAHAYEQNEKKQFLSRVDEAHVSDEPNHWALADLVGGYTARITGDEELEYLLEHFDYLSAAGMGSRFLLGGLQLPQPSLVPPHPTKANMVPVPTAPLHELTGQQFAVSSGAIASATLSVNPLAGVSPEWITFDGDSPATSTTTQLSLPAQLPPQPSPEWRGATSPTLPGEGTIDVQPLPPLSQQPLFVAMKNQLGWSDNGQPRTILPLPQGLMTLLAGNNGLRLQLSPQAPPDSNATPVESPPATPLSATPVLLIRLSLSQVPASTSASVVQAGSPVTGSPTTAGVAVRFLPHVYQLGGTSEETRELIHHALMGDLSQARISLLYTETKDSSSRPGSPTRTTTILRSDALDAGVLLAKTNLSTLNQIPTVSYLLADISMEHATSEDSDLAPITDVRGFLRLIWEVSVVNAPGFFLFYLTKDGHDLPASLFLSSGTTGGQTVEFDVLVELAREPAAPTALPEFANGLLVDEVGSSNTLYAQVSDSQGTPILTYAPTYPAGNIGLSLAWDHPDASPGSLVPVEDLYHLLQYRVADEGGYSGSVWSLPMGPTRENMPELLRRQNNESLWEFLQTIPTYLFFGPPSPPTSLNRYATIGQQLTLELRIIDIYGNAFPDVHTTSEVPLYQDPLLGLGEWPGTSVQYRVLPGGGSAASLVITLHFDPESVVPPGDSPGIGIDPTRAWKAVLQRYELIVDQLTDPHTSINLSTTLTAGPVGDAETTASSLIGFARNIQENIEAGLASARSPSVPAVSPVTKVLQVTLPFSDLAAQKDDIFAITVSVGFSRKESLVFPTALTQLPAASSVRYDVPPDLSCPPVSPATSDNNLMAFAVPFEQAFQNFDGRKGCLKLAQRAGVHSGQNTSAIQSLWAVRWSDKQGITVTLHDALVFFALRPLSNKPINHSVDGATYSNVDLDAWARDFLLAFDALLAPESAVAIGILDTLGGTGFYNQLMQAKQRLAEAIPQGVIHLFEQQNGQGDLTAARERLSQALLKALGSAFTVTTTLQIPAKVSISGSPGTYSPDVAPRLFGSIAPPERNTSPGSSSPSQSAPYSLSSGELAFEAGKNWMTTLLTVAQPEQQSSLTLPLSYQVSYLQHDFQPGEEYLGYVPSSWLKFAIPDAAPLQMPITGDLQPATLPIPLILEPKAPDLVQQSATAAALTSPASPMSPGQELTDALRWLYSVQIALDLAGQDELFLDVTYNRNDHFSAGMLAAGNYGHLGLFEALARFRAWYTVAAPQLGTISAEAYPSRPLAGATGSPQSARDLIEGFTTHAQFIARAWEELYEKNLMLADLPGDVITDYFRLTRDSSVPNTLQLAGRANDGGVPKYWPSIRTGDGQWWHPQPSGARQASSGQWVSLTHTFQPGVQFNALTFEFGPLALLERQTATMSAYIRRNAQLLQDQDMTTSEAFIYTTQTVSFANSIIPLIHRASLPPVTPGRTLADTLAQILSPLAKSDSRLMPRLRMSASYAYALATPASGPPLLTSTGLMMTNDANIDASPATIIEDAARSLADWYTAVQPSNEGALLSLALTLFGSLNGEELPLIQFDEIPIKVDGLPREWWLGDSQDGA